MKLGCQHQLYRGVYFLSFLSGYDLCIDIPISCLLTVFNECEIFAKICFQLYTLPGANVELYLYRVSSDINSGAVLAARPTQR